jgi:hypothetical protein
VGASNIDDIMYACVIMHNMVLKDEDGENLHDLMSSSFSIVQLPSRGFIFWDLQEDTMAIWDFDVYYNLQDDLVSTLVGESSHNFIKHK